MVLFERDLVRDTKGLIYGSVSFMEIFSLVPIVSDIQGLERLSKFVRFF